MCMEMVLPMHVIISSEINVECMHDHARHEIQLATMSYKLNGFMRDCCIMDTAMHWTKLRFPTCSVSKL